MPGLSSTIARLNAGRHPFSGSFIAASSHLGLFAWEGSNPGTLKAWSYVPTGRGNMPLVVVLHGCTQSAAGYDNGSGWSTLAERHGFAVLFPEQQRVNNPNLCFNWFSPEDARRGSGEAASIRAMVDAMVTRYSIDASRIYVTGLSAGGAMTSVLLASYPEVFAGGAIIAGLPYGAADTMMHALERMRGQGHVDAQSYAAAVRGASDHQGTWPTVAVWHGSADAVVVPRNADAILGQWQAVHGLPTMPAITGVTDGATHRIWRDGSGRTCLEDYRIEGMGHGTPLATNGSRGCGTPAAHMLDVGISSTWHIARGWGLLDTDAERITPASAMAPQAVSRSGAAASPTPSASPLIQSTIEQALRVAGLMR